jgi:hypothetical protein
MDDKKSAASISYSGDATRYSKTGNNLPIVPRSAKRAAFLKTLYQWHWISSALCLLGLLLFSITGITLNHATQIEAEPVVTTREGVLPDELQNGLRDFAAKRSDDDAALPENVQHWLAANWSLDVAGQLAEWSEDEVYLPLPRPGGDAWLRINLEDGALEYELTDRGWISWLNDLHKGRHTSAIWNWFIDILAGACLLFALTGLLILKFHAAKRPLTWPMVGLGVLIPTLLAILFVH